MYTWANVFDRPNTDDLVVEILKKKQNPIDYQTSKTVSSNSVNFSFIGPRQTTSS